MSLLKRYLWLAFALSLSACSVPPQVAQLTGYETIDIVDRIRCEAREAVQRVTIEILRTDNTERQEDDELIQYLEAAPDHWLTKNIEKNLVTARQKKFYDRFIESGMALDFTFDVSEDNKNSTEIDLLKAISKGTVGLNFIASDEHKRGNRREFLISETFGHLLNDECICSPIVNGEIRRSQNFGIPNAITPITGSINIAELIRFFIQINREAILQKGKDDAAPTVANTLMFTTTYIGSVNPTLAISPIGRTFDFKLASLTGQATRSDINQVLIGLSLQPRTSVLARRPRTVGLAVPPARGFGAEAFARGRIKPSEQRAIDAVTQQKIDTFYDRFNLLR